ncbi:MAG: bifunctional enoyl-CoA hydratase/phosphate acetyltransferase [Bacteroidetes bacterium]|nr:bifunctional enoyl-CoA hydratase/phosphate acetyltransferase [Bacteroidota bacterium]MBU1719782.1 bifunctional enoyl-CoA hydratase/phosphate acetyltransferase [Bacteroidota bacterium]
MITKLESFIEIAKSKPRRRIVVAAAADEPVLEAISNAMHDGIIEPILVGAKAEIEKIAAKIGFNLNGIEIIDVADPYEASVKAVSVVRAGKAEIIMKGLVSTGPLMKAVLDKEKGLRKGATLSHIAFFETPYYHKLIAVTDAALNVAPEFEEKVEIVKNAVDTYHKLGIKNPKVAVVCAAETVNPKMEATVHAAMLTMMNKRGQIKGCIIDGPLGLDNAVSEEAAHHKGIKSDVAGDADIIMCPEINAGNLLYKSMNFLGGAVTAAVIMGAKVPIVLTSRADSDKSKQMSITLAAALD